MEQLAHVASLQHFQLMASSALNTKQENHSLQRSYVDSCAGASLSHLPGIGEAALLAHLDGPALPSSSHDMLSAAAGGMSPMDQSRNSAAGALADPSKASPSGVMSSLQANRVYSLSQLHTGSAWAEVDAVKCARTSSSIASLPGAMVLRKDGSTTQWRRQNRHRQLQCQSCGTKESPEWRKGPNGGRTLCNACGLQYAKALKKQKLGSDKAPSDKQGAKRGDLSHTRPRKTSLSSGRNEYSGSSSSPLSSPTGSPADRMAMSVQSSGVPTAAELLGSISASAFATFTPTGFSYPAGSSQAVPPFLASQSPSSLGPRLPLFLSASPPAAREPVTPSSPMDSRPPNSIAMLLN